MRPGSSPSCARPGCWYGCGSARPIRDRSPDIPSPSPATPGRTEHRCGTAADGWPLGSLCPGCGTAGTGHLAEAAERSGAPQFTAPERDEIYRHAARQARAAAEHIRHCAMTDPAAAADAAWAAADTLHVAARALRNPHLRCAADSYDRAARAQYGRMPRRSHDGDQLRRTARMIALAGNLTGDITLTAIALVAQLVALAAAVAELRQAQRTGRPGSRQPAPQPLTCMRLLISPGRGQPASVMPAHAGLPRQPTLRSLPAGLPCRMGQPQPTAGSAEPARSRSRQQPRPGRRAGPAP